MSKLHLWALVCSAGLGTPLAVALADSPPSAAAPATHPPALQVWRTGPVPPFGPPFGGYPGAGPFGSYGPVPWAGYPWPPNYPYPPGLPQVAGPLPTAPAPRATIQVAPAAKGADRPIAGPATGSASEAPSTAPIAPSATQSPHDAPAQPHFRPWTPGKPSTADEASGHDAQYTPGPKALEKVPRATVRRTPDGFLINGAPPVFRPLPSENVPKTRQHATPKQPAGKPLRV
jgi:hypothetical protein